MCNVNHEFCLHDWNSDFLKKRSSIYFKVLSSPGMLKDAFLKLFPYCGSDTFHLGHGLIERLPLVSARGIRRELVLLTDAVRDHIPVL